MDDLSTVSTSVMMASLLSSLVVFVISVLVVVSSCIVFKKMGKPWWAALIPIYNVWVLLQVFGKPWWWLLLLLFVPIANVIIAILLMHELSKSFGQGAGFTVGLVLLPIIFLPLLAFGKNYTFRKTA